jgi:hypothetical protein
MSLENDKIESVHQEGEMAGPDRYVTIESTDLPRRDGPEPDYTVYKRRFFGLGQLVLLNIVVSWDVRETSNFMPGPILRSAARDWRLTDIVWL